MFSSLFSRRIHITEETHKFLGGDYEVEEGHGGDRHPYLREHNIKSYLVIPPDNFHEVSRMFTANYSLFIPAALSNLPFSTMIPTLLIWSRKPSMI